MVRKLFIRITFCLLSLNFANAQSLSLDATDVGAVTLDGALIDAAATAASKTVTVVLADVDAAFNGTVFLNLYNANATLTNADRRMGKNLLTSDAAESAGSESGLKTLTWTVATLDQSATIPVLATDDGTNFVLIARVFAGIGENSNSKEIVAANVTTLSTNRIQRLSSNDFYPNPATTTINISSDVITKNYRVINLLGREVLNVKANGTLDISGLANGMYILLTDSGSTKFIKE